MRESRQEQGHIGEEVSANVTSTTLGVGSVNWAFNRASSDMLPVIRKEPGSKHAILGPEGMLELDPHLQLVW